MRSLRKIILLAIILISVKLAYATLTLGHEWGDDWASYIMQAESILKGDTDGFIEQNTFTIFESSSQIGPVAYPWGYPLLLVPVLILEGIHPIALKLPGMLFFAGFLYCFYLLISERLGNSKSLILVLLFAVNPVFVKFQDNILSDIPFLFFVILALLLMNRPKLGVKNYIVLGVVIFFAAFIRTMGIILLATFLIYQANCFFSQQGERKAVFINSIWVTLTFILLWGISSLVFPNGQGAYFEQLKSLSPPIFRENFFIYVFLFREFFGVNFVWPYVYAFVFVLFLIGVWGHRNSDQPLVIFFTLYFVALVFWPERQGIRFIFPLLPIFIYFAFQGGNTIVGFLKHRQEFGTYLLHAFWLMITVMLLYTSVTQARDNLGRERRIGGPFDPFTKQIYDFVTKKTPPDSVIVFFKPRVMALMTGHNSIMSMECDRMLTGDYVVISKKDGGNQQIPPDQFHQCNLPADKVFENLRFIVYQINN